MANHGLNEDDRNLETLQWHQQDHLSLLVIHRVCHFTQDRHSCGAADEKLMAAISADHLWLPALPSAERLRGTFLSGS